MSEEQPQEPLTEQTEQTSIDEKVGEAVQPEIKEAVFITQTKRLNEIIALTKARTRAHIERQEKPQDFEDVFAFYFAIAMARECFKLYDYAARNNKTYREIFKLHLGVSVVKPWYGEQLDNDNNG